MAIITNKDTTEWISTKTDRKIPNQQNLILWHMFSHFSNIFWTFFLSKNKTNVWTKCFKAIKKMQAVNYDKTTISNIKIFLKFTSSTVFRLRVCLATWNRFLPKYYPSLKNLKNKSFKSIALNFIFLLKICFCLPEFSLCL